MNIQKLDILNILSGSPYVNQRLLAEQSGHSLGVVNRSLRTLRGDGYLSRDMALTEKARQLLAERAPKNAVILAAGTGMRMAPINTETPKGLLEVHGEALIERVIRQLREAGIRDITVVVGFMMEQYEYLMDKYGAELIVNSEYAARNNLHSLALARERLSNTYIVPCDIWFEQNPFSSHELYSWYMVTDQVKDGSAVRVNRKLELVTVPRDADGCGVIGVSYLLEEQAAIVRERLGAMDLDRRYDGAFWEETLYENDRLLTAARLVRSSQAVEINTYEQLRELDSGSSHLRSDAITTAAGVLQAAPEDITDITVLKKGMTNRSFLFSCKGRRFIMRIPGEGTDKLIVRAQEAAVYEAIRGRGLCDDPVYIDPATGYKITEYLNAVRPCDPESGNDVRRCMEKLRSFHDMDLTAPHEFDIFEKIGFYESLRNGAPSAYRDYEQTKANVFSLRPYIDAHVERRCLTHIDAVPDNFLFVPRGGGEDLQLIDWEYAAMQDPHVDIAMFCIYAMYDQDRIDRLIDAYFPEGCPEATRLKIYCYIAACGLLWSNWCEYKRSLGVEFGAYALRQYRYAKDYYRLVRDALGG